MSHPLCRRFIRALPGAAALLGASALAPLAAHAQEDGGIVVGIISLFMSVVWFGMLVLVMAGMWKLFEKAGKPGWAALVPIYNIVVMLEIARMPLWWLAVFFVPFANLAAVVMLSLNLAKAFGKDTAYAIGILLLSPIFLPLLGFGDARYQTV